MATAAMRIFLLLSILSATGSFMAPEKKFRMICIGDSYTIGEAVKESERFPVQTVELLKKSGIEVDAPVIIAKTGWTTDELISAIKLEEENGKLETGPGETIVTLLIGVNNEFRGRDTGEYRKEFAELVKVALKYAGNNTNHVFVLSIPDWGATPFAAKDPKHRSPEQIAHEIDVFNALNYEETFKAHAHYLDITPVSRKAVSDPGLLAEDGLHPSGKMYAEWAEALASQIRAALK